MQESEVDMLFKMLEKSIKADDKTEIINNCSRLLEYSNHLDEKTQVGLFLVKGISLLKQQHYTLALLNVQRAIEINSNDNKLCLDTLEYVKKKIME